MNCAGKGKEILLQAWTGPEGYRKWRLPDFQTIGTWRWQDCQPYTPAAFTHQELFLVLISVREWVDPKDRVWPEWVSQWKIPMTPLGNRTRDLPGCSAVSQPTAPPRAQNARTCLTSWGTNSFTKRTVLHIVSWLVTSLHYTRTLAIQKVSISLQQFCETQTPVLTAKNDKIKEEIIQQ